MSTLAARLDRMREGFEKQAPAEALAIMHAATDDLRGIYETFGITLPDFNGDDTWELPLPARIVVDATGVIRTIDADPDYTRRPEPDATREALRAIA